MSLIRKLSVIIIIWGSGVLSFITPSYHGTFITIPSLYRNHDRLKTRPLELTTMSPNDDNDNNEGNNKMINDNQNNNSPKKKNETGNGMTDRFEALAKTVGFADEDYKFGDLSRQIVDITTDTIRTITGNDDYQFGDITKNMTVMAVNATEGTIRSISGDEDYQLGDLTKSVVNDVTTSGESVSLLVKLCFNIYHRLPSNNLLRRFFHELLLQQSVASSPSDSSGKLKDKSNSSAMIATLQLIAFIGLTLHFVLNICHSCSIIASWGYTWWKIGTSPLQTHASWQMFLSVQSTLKLLVVGPLALPVQVGITFFLSIPYRDFVVLGLEQNLLQVIIPKRVKRKLIKFPVLKRFLALFLAYLLGNGLMVATFTCFGCFSVGAMYRFLMLP